MKNKNLLVTMTVLFLLAVIIIGSYCTISVNAAGKIAGDRDVYHAQEAVFLEELRQKLETEGYYNSGITMTKILNEEDERSYTVLIHNSAIDKLCKEDRDSLQKELQTMDNIGKNSSICYEFLVIEG